jgi:hypothetical protein
MEKLYLNPRFSCCRLHWIYFPLPWSERMGTSYLLHIGKKTKIEVRKDADGETGRGD